MQTPNVNINIDVIIFVAAAVLTAYYASVNRFVLQTQIIQRHMQSIVPHHRHMVEWPQKWTSNLLDILQAWNITLLNANEQRQMNNCILFVCLIIAKVLDLNYKLNFWFSELRIVMAPSYTIQNVCITCMTNSDQIDKIQIKNIKWLFGI